MASNRKIFKEKKKVVSIFQNYFHAEKIFIQVVDY